MFTVCCVSLRCFSSVCIQREKKSSSFQMCMSGGRKKRGPGVWHVYVLSCSAHRFTRKLFWSSIFFGIFLSDGKFKTFFFYVLFVRVLISCLPVDPPRRPILPVQASSTSLPLSETLTASIPIGTNVFLERMTKNVLENLDARRAQVQDGFRRRIGCSPRRQVSQASHDVRGVACQ